MNRKNGFKMRSSVLRGVLLLVAATVAPTMTSTAQAQDIQITGPLAGQPAVRHMRQYRVNRVQLIVPAVGFTLQDQFARSLMTGVEVNYHFLDYLGIGVYGAAANFGNAFQINTDLTSQTSQNGQTTPGNRLSLPNPQNFDQQVARLQGLVSAHLIFSPLRGKVSLFQGAFVDTDFYILAGVALAFVQERADTAAGVCDSAGDACNQSQSAHQNRLAPAPMFGVGLNLYFNSWLGLAIQWRAFPFNMNAGGFDTGGGSGSSSVSIQDGRVTGADQQLYFNHMVNVGLIINLPTDIAVTE